MSFPGTGVALHANNQHATGKRVYGGPSGPSHATAGTVNPMGYVQREQRRSGLAQAILGRTSQSAGSPNREVASQLGELVSNHPYSVLARLKLAQKGASR